MSSRWQELARRGNVEQPIDLPGNKWKSIGNQFQETKEPVTFLRDIKTALHNVPSDSIKVAKTQWEGLTSPLDVLASIGNMIKEASGLMGTGGAVSPIDSENLSQVADGIVEQYGSLEKFRESAINRPVQTVMDVASVTSLIKPKAGVRIEPVNLASTAVNQIVRAPIRLIPSKLSRRLWESSAKLGSTITDPKIRSKLINTALDKQIAPTFKGMERLQTQINVFNDQIQDLIDAASIEGKVIPTKKLIKFLPKLEKEIMGLTAKPIEARNAIKNIRKQIIDANIKIKRVKSTKKVESKILGPDGKPVQVEVSYIKKEKTLKKMSASEFHELKKGIYQELESFYEKVGSSNASVQAQKAVARAAKETLEDLIPELKLLNKNEGELIALRKAINKAAIRIRNKDLLGLGTTAKAAVGQQVAGPFGAAVGGGLGILDNNPAIKAKLALAIEKLKKRGVKVRTTPTLLRLLAFQAGRLTEEEENK